jgi:cell division protein FtsX
VLLISVAYGVADAIDGHLASPALRAGDLVDVDLIDRILFLLTVVVTAGMLLQTSAATFTLGVTVMSSRREEVGLRQPSGVLRSRLIGEFLRGVLVPCVLGGAAGEIAGARPTPAPRC